MGVILYFLLAHWVADFVLQSDDDAKNKSKSWTHLLNHTFSYSCFMLLSLALIFPETTVRIFIYFFTSMLVSHTLIDAITSRINSKLYSSGKTHLFFVSIGFDQWLHYLVLFMSIQFLYNI